MKTKILPALVAVTALGCALVPLASYADTKTQDVEIDIIVDSTIDLELDTESVSGTVNAGETKTDMQVTATVTTNASTYNVTLESTSATTGLVGDNGTIATAAGRPTTSTATWAACVGDSTDCNDTTNASLDSIWYAIPANSESGGTPINVATSKAKAETESYVTFGFSSTGVAAGDYTNNVLFTAIAANVSSD